jgi:hypothetical protein
MSSRGPDSDAKGMIYVIRNTPTFGELADPENGGSEHLGNVATHTPAYTV